MPEHAVAALLLCFAVPVVLTMGLAGSIADRGDPRRVLGIAGLVQVLACLGLAGTRNLAATYVLVLALSSAVAFAMPVWTSVLSRAVGNDGIGRLLSIQHALTAIAAPLGAGFAGLIVQYRGDRVVYLVDAASYLVLLVVGVTLRTRPARSVPESSPGLLPRAGFRLIRADRLIAMLFIALIPYVITLESMNAVEVFLVRDVLGGTQAQFGLTQVVTGAGAVVGALVAGRIATDRRRVLAALLALTTIAVAMVGMGLAPTLAVFFVATLVSGLANAVLNTSFFALLVRRTAEADRGKVIALVNGLARSCSVCALLLGGLMGATLGPRGAYVVAGGLGLLVSVWAVVAVRRDRVLDADPLDDDPLGDGPLKGDPLGDHPSGADRSGADPSGADPSGVDEDVATPEPEVPSSR